MRALDCGAGNGRNIGMLSEFFKTIDVVEINKKYIKELQFLKKKYSNIDLVLEGSCTEITYLK